MKYTVYEIKLKLDYTETDILKKLYKITGLSTGDIEEYRIVRRSLDARKSPVYNLTVEIECAEGVKPSPSKQIKKSPEPEALPEYPVLERMDRKPPVIVGAGPAGLTAALFLAEHGACPVVLERGNHSEVRFDDVRTFWETGTLNTESNVLFGEGGAGLFSDGKLTARSKERAAKRYFFETLVSCGAPESILMDAEPHLGTDMMLKIIPKLRERISELGGEIYYNAGVVDFEIENGRITGVVSESGIIDTDYCLLAVGHSARDMYRLLAEKNTALEEKPFAVGLRLELPQETVDRAQYGKAAGTGLLEPASFRFTRKAEDRFRSCYTFCMCPGGEVMSCASSEGMLTTNGMSYSKRNRGTANAAFLIPVTAEDFADFRDDEYPPLSGVRFQEEYEKKVFEAGGSDYSVPASLLSDFLSDTESLSLTYSASCRRIKPVHINPILPEYITESLMHWIPEMLKPFHGLDYDDVTVYAAETRSSAPVRILRNRETYESETLSGLYPCGEGSGYAGGIVSSALDGMHAAESVLIKLCNS